MRKLTVFNRWLVPLRSVLPEITTEEWARLSRLEELLYEQTRGSEQLTGPERAAWLLDIRRRLAEEGYSRQVSPQAPVELSRVRLLQTLAQFVCGFFDLDLRDATGLGHGALLANLTDNQLRRLWLSRVSGGELIGVAATERRGGSRIQEISTAAQEAGTQWLISGEKTWVSRLNEAVGWVVFFRGPTGDISAAVVDATAPGLHRQPLPPAGLGGWSWGVLTFDNVPINPVTDLVGRYGDGLGVFRQHFTRFRPLVTATALGTAAAAHTLVTQTLATRVSRGEIPRVRDNALVTLGQTYAEVHAALLATLATVRLGATGAPQADMWARVNKAYGVDVANKAVSDLATLIGAAGFTTGSRIAKARADLTGLLYADGIHDSLYRSGGKTLLAEQDHWIPPRPEVPQERASFGLAGTTTK
ncbi:MAG: acyl-CoA dehydrogenase family protein [Pseudomonas fluorescens]